MKLIIAILTMTFISFAAYSYVESNILNSKHCNKIKMRIDAYVFNYFASEELEKLKKYPDVKQRQAEFLDKADKLSNIYRVVCKSKEK